MGSSVTMKKLQDAIEAYEDRIKFFDKIGQSELRNIEEKGFIKGFLYFYLNAKKDNPSKHQELKRMKRNFHSKISMLLAKPLFSKRKKVIWTFFILFPRLYEWGLYVNKKLQV